MNLPPLLDAHAHLDQYDDQTLPTVLATLAAQRIFTIAVSMDADSFARTRAIAAQSPWVVPAFGIHPWRAADAWPQRHAWQHLLHTTPILGEVGLDTVWAPPNSLETQRRVFHLFLEAAATSRKLLNLHTKGAEAEIRNALRAFGIAPAIIHWYSGPLDVLDDLIADGHFFTIGVELPHSPHIQTIARRIPLNQLLTETDNPTGLPWLIGELGMPHHLHDVLTHLAHLRGLSVNALRRRIWENWQRLRALYGLASA